MEFAGAPREATAIASIVSDLLSVAAAILAVQVVKDIDRRQEETSSHLTFPPFPQPPPPPVFGASTSALTTPAGSIPQESGSGWLSEFPGRPAKVS
jgi:hypothetical protein